MARTTHVNKAQQRYETVPVIDPETGEPKRTPVMKKVKDYDTGEVTLVQRTTKRGKPVFMAVTVQDKSKPKPLYTCDSCGKPIEIGTPYKHVTPKSGPYGGYKRTRHESCPSWKIWELSNSWSARIAQATDGFDVADLDSPEDIESALTDVAEEIRSLAEESRETASNIEDGFGHPTSQSEEAEQRADDLDTWADEIEQADIPELPEPEARYFVTNGDGVASDLFEADGYETEAEAEQALTEHREDEDNEDDGFEVEEITPDEPTEEQMEEWRDEVRESVTIVDESPV